MLPFQPYSLVLVPLVYPNFSLLPSLDAQNGFSQIRFSGVEVPKPERYLGHLNKYINSGLSQYKPSFKRVKTAFLINIVFLFKLQQQFLFH